MWGFLQERFYIKTPINPEERQQNVTGTDQENLPKCAENAVKTVNIDFQ